MPDFFSINASTPVTANGPYPPVKVLGKNPRWANLVSQPLRSNSGEMTAITSYLYQHWTLPACYKPIANLVYRIAKVEMHHMDLLGRLTVCLGGTPRFAIDACTTWSGMATDYSSTLRHMLLENLSGEQAAVNAYASMAKEITDPYARQVLLRISQDELLHVHLFKNLLDHF